MDWMETNANFNNSTCRNLLCLPIALVDLKGFRVQFCWCYSEMHSFIECQYSVSRSGLIQNKKVCLIACCAYIYHAVLTAIASNTKVTQQRSYRFSLLNWRRHPFISVVLAEFLWSNCGVQVLPNFLFSYLRGKGFCQENKAEVSSQLLT